MEKQHSKEAKISFISMLIFVFFLLISFITSRLSEYIAYQYFELLDQIFTYSIIIFTSSFLVSLFTSIKCLRHKDSNLLLPVSAFSVNVFFLIFMSPFVLLPYFFKVNVCEGLVTNFGVFEIPEKIMPNGENKALYEQRYLRENSEIIPAELNTRFGFNYVVPGVPRNESIEISKITKFPNQGLFKEGEIIYSDTNKYEIKLNDLEYCGYKFRDDSELLYGKWEFEIWYNNRLLLSKKFEVCR